MITFPEGASDYYNVEAARKLLEKDLPDGYKFWRCVLCGWPIALNPQQQEIAGACCCGGCGMTTLRPIEEYKTYVYGKPQEAK